MKQIKKYIEISLPLLFSKTAKNTYLVSLGNVLGLGFAFIFYIVTYALLSYADYGYLSALWAMLLLVSDVADIGIGSSLSRFLPPLERDEKRLSSFLKTAFILQVVIALFLSAIFFLASPVIAEVLFHNPNLPGLVKVTSLGIFFAIISNFFLYTMSAKQKFIQVAFITASGAFFRIILMLIFIILAAVTLDNMVWSQSIGYILPIVFGLYFIKISFLSVQRTKGDFKKLISFSSYLGIARSLTAVASRLDVLMLFLLLSQVKAPVEAGIYSGAVRFIAPYPLFAGSFSAVIAPRMATFDDLRQLKPFLIKVILATLGLIGSIFVFMIAARPVLSLFLGDKIDPSIPVLQLLLVSQIFFVASIPAVNVAIYYLKKPHILSINSILQLIIVILGNILFIPRFGRFGPGLSLIMAYGLTLLLTSYMAYYYYKRQHG